jgi:DNA mismatch repair ATPase MutS
MDPLLLKPTAAVKCYTMSVVETQRGSGGAQQLAFLYKLVPGRMAPSYGVFCARMVGVRTPAHQLGWDT